MEAMFNEKTGVRYNCVTISPLEEGADQLDLFTDKIRQIYVEKILNSVV